MEPSNRSRLHAKPPGAPWLRRKDWASGRIRCSSRRTAIAAWFFALFWNAASSPIFFFLPEEVFRKKNHLAWFGLLFPFIGIGLFAWALRATWRWKKFGTSIFELASVPGVIGGRLAGAIRAGIKLRPEDGFHLKLTCVCQETRQSGEDSTVDETILWQDEQTMAREVLGPGAPRTAIPVCFQIPGDCQESSAASGSRRIIWRLEAGAGVPGADYHAVFEVPVFKTESSSQTAAASSDPVSAYRAKVDPERWLADPKIAIKPIEPDGLEIFFAAGRNPSAAISLTAFFVIWTGLCVFLFFIAPVIFPLVSSLFGLFIAYGVLDLWLAARRVVIGKEAVEITSGLLGWERTVTLPREEIADIKVAIGMRTNTTLYYDLKICCRGGRKHTAGSAIRDQRQAEWLAGEMKTRLQPEPVEEPALV